MHKTILQMMIILCACVAGVAQAENVYEWRDAQGVEHMSDTPPSGDQQGVTMRKINGQEVNTFDMGVSASSEAAPAASSSSPPAQPQASGAASSGAASSGAEQECLREYGGPCDWVHNWQVYGQAECERTREPRCNDQRYFNETYRPRRVSERRPGETAGTYDAVRHHGVRR